DPQQQKELQARDQWLSSQQQKDPRFETTKLEWAKQLRASELSVLEDPQKNFGQMGTGDLPPGAEVVALPNFLTAMNSESAKLKPVPEYWKQELVRMEDKYQPAKGVIVKYDPKSIGKGYISTRYAWYPAREAPLADIKGLARLKGHLQQGLWLTKFRKWLRKDEMTQAMVLAAVPKTQEQTYIRIMPTSPP